MRIVAAVDKFKGTVSAADVAAAVGHACWELGHECDEAPVADGGDGTLEALGGANRTTRVTGPLGQPVDAAWRWYHDTAVIEMARASGLTLVGGAEHNDPVAASTIGTGELIDHALDLGAKRILVGLGGSATTDGGLGAVQAIRSPARLRGVEFLVACDVRTRFTDAAAVFAPQKGATPAQVRLLTARLGALARTYRDDYGVDVSDVEGAGAAGGLAGGLVALGARLTPGFDLVADEVDLFDRMATADLVVTGEGFLDEQSFEGKVVGGVVEMAAELGRPVVIVVGDVDESLGWDPTTGRLGRDLGTDARVVSLVQRFGSELAMREPRRCIEQAAAEALRGCAPRPDGDG